MRFRPGDMLGFSTWTRLGVGINLCTLGVPFWGLSHVAIVTRIPGERRLVLCESTSLADTACLVQRKIVKGIQFHHIGHRVRSYQGLVWRYPIVGRLSQKQSKWLREWCLAHVGSDYDTLGAVNSRDTLLACLLRKPEDLSSLFCSEWCAATYRALGGFSTDNVSAWSPNRIARAVVRQGTCHRPEIIKSRPCPVGIEEMEGALR